MTTLQRYTGETDFRPQRINSEYVTITNADLTESGNTETISLGDSLPLNALIVGYRLRLVDAFDSPGGGSLDVQIGDDTTDDDSVLAAYDAYTGSAFESATLWSVGTPGVRGGGMSPPTGDQLEILLTSTTDNLDTFTNGDLDIEVFWIDLQAQADQ